MKAEDEVVVTVGDHAGRRGYVTAVSGALAHVRFPDEQFPRLLYVDQLRVVVAQSADNDG